MTNDADDQGIGRDVPEAGMTRALEAAFSAAGGDHPLRDAPRLFFVAAAEVARAWVDPADDWNAFLEALWEQMDAGFGLTQNEAEEGSGPRAWFDVAGDPPVVAWDDQRPDDLG